MAIDVLDLPQFISFSKMLQIKSKPSIMLAGKLSF